MTGVARGFANAVSGVGGIKGCCDRASNREVGVDGEGYW